MKVILLTDIKGSGRKYDVKNISDGYAMNFLLPNKLAERATPERIKKIKELKKEDRKSNVRTPVTEKSRMPSSA